MHRKGGSGGGIHREERGILLTFVAIGDYCGETPIFLYPALENLNTKVISRSPHWPG